MTKARKASTLGDQVKAARESMKTWPEWMREAARFSGEPAVTRQAPASEKEESARNRNRQR